MRATRAYIAGFGTAGSILACAAVLFVIASAVITLNGWPTLSAQHSPAAIRITQAQAAAQRASGGENAAAAKPGATLGAGGGSVSGDRTRPAKRCLRMTSSAIGRGRNRSS